VADGDPNGVTFVSVGRSLPRHRVEVVCRERGTPLGERQVGELVAEGASLSPGYFTEQRGAPRSRLHTEDLGYLAGGHLYVVDRIKDLVIVNGQNYSPSDIEG